MVEYVGFTTQNYCTTASSNFPYARQITPSGESKIIKSNKKFTLTGSDLVIQDLVNAFNIRYGTKVGQPGYGTKIWDLLFEQNISETQQLIEADVRNIALQDPRIELNRIVSYPRDNGILVEVEMAITPYNEPLLLTVLFNTTTRIATMV